MELPDCNQKYAVKFLNGFVSKSWLDYVSFGVLSTGGWSDGDGIINCVKSSYDLEDENFTVSLLKHEAQHAVDLKAYPEMTSADLEYRAKLVELIYSAKRNMLEQFSYEADSSKDSNGHAMAASKIVAEFKTRTRENLTKLSIEKVQRISRDLFVQSNQEIRRKYLT